MNGQWMVEPVSMANGRVHLYRPDQAFAPECGDYVTVERDGDAYVVRSGEYELAFEHPLDGCMKVQRERRVPLRGRHWSDAFGEAMAAIATVRPDGAEALRALDLFLLDAAPVTPKVEQCKAVRSYAHELAALKAEAAQARPRNCEDCKASGRRCDYDGNRCGVLS